jgi:glycosyltransferase involved in cell wall biosynthesis
MSETRQSDSSPRPGIVLMGPDPAQVGGWATLVRFVLSSPYLQERYRLILVDTGRGSRGAGRAGTFAAINVWYFLRQAAQLAWVRLRWRPELANIPMNPNLSFWKYGAFILLGRALGMKVIVHWVAGTFPAYWAGRSPRVRSIIRWTLNRSDVMIALSNGWRRFLREEVGVSVPMEVVPNAVDPSFAAISDRVTYGPERGPGAILFVGILDPEKGVFDILDAAPTVIARHPEACFLFAGAEDDPAVRVRLDQACAERGLGNAVRFLGRVTGQAKLDLYLRSSIFILPSYGEGQSYALLEAMCTGLPVVSTPVGATPELIQEGQNGFLIQPGDSEALAERIVRLLDDRALRATMSKANVEIIRKGYLPNVALSCLESVFTRLLEPVHRQSAVETGDTL